MSLNFLDCLNRALHRINPEACIILAVAVFIFFLQLIEIGRASCRERVLSNV